MKLHITHGHIIDPANQIDAVHDLYIAEGIVVGLDDAPADFTADQTIDASGLLITPGLVDLSTRLGASNQNQTVSIASETQAAIHGGITTVCLPPDASPLIDSPAAVDLIEGQAHRAHAAKVHTIGALTQGLNGELLSEMLALKQAGCLGVSNGLNPIQNTLVLRRAMEYAATLDLTLFIHAADPWLQSQGCVHEGIVSSRLGLGGIPEATETIAIARDISLIEQTGVSAHFHNISSGKTLAMITEAQQRGVNITADVSINHLHLTEHDIGNYDSLCHVMPPLRTTRDRDQLQQGIADGSITAISAHHQPLDNDAKLGPFADTLPGISGLETLLPLSLKLADDGAFSRLQAIASLTYNPAQILGIDAGHLSTGSIADLCLINPKAMVSCDPKQFVSAGKNSPFGGWHFDHQVIATMINGRIVYPEG